MEALIDGDLCAYRCAASAEQEGAGLAIYRCNELIERILNATSSDSFSVYLSGDSNFRYVVNPQYKAHRKDKPKPTWLNDCKQYLVEHWNAVVMDGIEADDGMGIAQRHDTIICSLDKDMLQVPGSHYQWEFSGTGPTGKAWSKDAIRWEISEEEGLKRFWTQMIVGDVADNVFGVYGLGPKKTEKLFESIEGDTFDELNQAYYNLVKTLYNDEERLHSNAKLLWILRSEGAIWQPPSLKNGLQEESGVSLHPFSDLGPDVGLLSMIPLTKPV